MPEFHEIRTIKSRYERIHPKKLSLANPARRAMRKNGRASIFEGKKIDFLQPRRTEKLHQLVVILKFDRWRRVETFNGSRFMLIYRNRFAKFREKLTIRKIQFFSFHISTVDESDFNVAVDPDSPSPQFA